MEAFRTISSRCVLLSIDNVDTDQIIPARFLKTTSRSGLGRSLFADWRYDAAGQPRPDFVLNQPEAQGAQVLVAGDNFGCGSSREHAPWALLDYGFRAVISTSIADIFRNNALKNGFLPVVVDADLHRRLSELCSADPSTSISIDLEAQTVRLPDGSSTSFSVDAFARHCLLNGLDQLGFLLSEEQAIAAYEQRSRWEVLQ